MQLSLLGTFKPRLLHTRMMPPSSFIFNSAEEGYQEATQSDFLPTTACAYSIICQLENPRYDECQSLSIHATRRPQFTEPKRAVCIYSCSISCIHPDQNSQNRQSPVSYLIPGLNTRSPHPGSQALLHAVKTITSQCLWTQRIN